MQLAGRAQNAQNSVESTNEGNFAHFVRASGDVKNLFRRLLAAGVVLSMAPDGRLAYDAPAGVLGDGVLDSIRSNREDLLALVERIEERAAIMEYDGGFHRADAERLAVVDVVGT